MKKSVNFIVNDTIKLIAFVSVSALILLIAVFCINIWRDYPETWHYYLRALFCFFTFASGLFCIFLYGLERFRKAECICKNKRYVSDWIAVQIGIASFILYCISVVDSLTMGFYGFDFLVFMAGSCIFIIAVFCGILYLNEYIYGEKEEDEEGEL